MNAHRVSDRELDLWFASMGKYPKLDSDAMRRALDLRDARAEVIRLEAEASDARMSWNKTHNIAVEWKNKCVERDAEIARLSKERDEAWAVAEVIKARLFAEGYNEVPDWKLDGQIFDLACRARRYDGVDAIVRKFRAKAEANATKASQPTPTQVCDEILALLNQPQMTKRASSP